MVGFQAKRVPLLPLLALLYLLFTGLCNLDCLGLVVFRVSFRLATKKRLIDVNDFDLLFSAETRAHAR